MKAFSPFTIRDEVLRVIKDLLVGHKIKTLILFGTWENKRALFFVISGRNSYMAKTQLYITR